MSEERDRFFSKILLFGEYALMKGSQALSVPFRNLYGKFVFEDQAAADSFDSNGHLSRYAGYLRQQKQLRERLDVSLFEKEIDSGLVFKSNIPLGYGLGSSGALVAAIYERYARHKLPEENLPDLKCFFALMESWFHGKSSGLDPLICYLQKAVMVESEGGLKTVRLPEFKDTGGALFLLDSGTTGETQPLVNYFMEQCRDAGFLQQIRSELVPLNAECIRAYLSGDAPALLLCSKKLSAFTFRYFQPMIPEKLRTIWQAGLKSEDYFLKLCGSGGGGMMLGFTADFEKARQQLENFPVKIFQPL
jgi:mevalonate kinase